MENPIGGALPNKVTETYSGITRNHNLFEDLKTDETTTYKVSEKTGHT